MSDTQAAPMGEATSANEATKIVSENLEGKTAKLAAEKSIKEKGEPDLLKMTGEEAKAYVEAQKAKKNPVKEAIKEVVIKKASSKEPTPEDQKQAEAIRKHKVKVDGEELEVDDDELKRGYSHQKAANKILQEGLAARKQALEFIEMMKKDPKSIFEIAQKMGHDTRKISEEHLGGFVEEELMDPRDLALKRAQAKLKSIEEHEASQKKVLEDQKFEAMKKKYAGEYSDKFVESLKKYGLAPDKISVGQMAFYVGRAAKLGIKMTADEAAQLVREDDINRIKFKLREASPETILQVLGEDVANKIRGYDVAKIKSPEDHLKTPEEQAEPRDRNKTPHKRMTSREWRDFNRR